MVGYGDENSILSSPAIGLDGTVYIGCDNGKLYALNSIDGKLKVELSDRRKGLLLCGLGTDGTVYIGSCVWVKDFSIHRKDFDVHNYYFTAGRIMKMNGRSE